MPFALSGEGIDPVQARVIRRTERIASSAETFEAVAGEWFEKNKRFWSDVHYTKARQAFDRDVFPIVGRLPVADITSSVVALVISKILERGVAETASKILQHINGVFRLAQARGLRTDNPAAPARELISKRRTVTPRPLCSRSNHCAMSCVELMRRTLAKPFGSGRGWSPSQA